MADKFKDLNETFDVEPSDSESARSKRLKILVLQ